MLFYLSIEHFFPFHEAVEPFLGAVYPETLVVAAEGDVVGERAAWHTNHIRIVVGVGRQLAGDVLLGDTDAQSHGLTLVAGGVFL